MGILPLKNRFRKRSRPMIGFTPFGLLLHPPETIPSAASNRFVGLLIQLFQFVIRDMKAVSAFWNRLGFEEFKITLESPLMCGDPSAEICDFARRRKA